MEIDDEQGSFSLQCTKTIQMATYSALKCGIINKVVYVTIATGSKPYITIPIAKPGKTAPKLQEWSQVTRKTDIVCGNGRWEKEGKEVVAVSAASTRRYWLTSD
jgi:hypothetical protein